MVNFSMPQLRNQIEFFLATDWAEGEFHPVDFKVERTTSLLAELEDAVSA